MRRYRGRQLPSTSTRCSPRWREASDARRAQAPFINTRRSPRSCWPAFTPISVSHRRRGVLFVDLALAQMAALGVAVAWCWGARRRGGLVPAGARHDHARRGAVRVAAGTVTARTARAFIGIVFATAQALAFLLLEKTPSGRSTSRRRWSARCSRSRRGFVAVVAGLYAIVSLVHVFLRKPFMEITNDPEGAKAWAAPIPLGLPVLRRSASWSPRRCRSPACCWCSGSL